jgi:hypothetical protein
VSAVDVLLAIEAATSGQVQRRTTVRHRHLEPEPLVIVAYRMAGEAGAPLGVMYGTSRDAPSLLVAPEPRSIGIRFRDVMNPFGEFLCNWLDPFVEEREMRQARHRVVEDCINAPQILVPNHATAGFVGAVLGRSLRYLRTEGDGAVPETTVLAGNHFTWFEQQSALEGSCVLLAATDLLRRHFATGQSDLEDEDLHVLLSWVDPPAGKTGAEAAAEMELARHSGDKPGAGPTPDADWDRDVLDPLLEVFNEQRAGSNDKEVVDRLSGDIITAVGDALAHSWDATWRAHEILLEMLPGNTVEDRWESDRRAWTYHADRVRDGWAFFRIKDTAKQAAWMISNREDALTALEAGEALDDPLVLAGLVAGGEALIGEVTALDRDNKEQGPKNMVTRPLIDLELGEPCPLPIGSTSYWTVRPGKAKVEVISVDGSSVGLKVVAGMTGDLPEPGTIAAFADLTFSSIPRPKAPQATPWTHVGAETPSIESEGPDDTE